MKRSFSFVGAALTGASLFGGLPAMQSVAVAAETAAAPAAATPAAAPQAAGVAAEVNAEKIALADVNRQVNLVRDAQPSLRGDTPEAKKALQEIRDTVLDGLIEWRLMVQEAKRQKVTPEAAQVDKALADFKKQYKTDADFQQALAKEGKKPADLRALISETLQVYELRQRWQGDVVVKEEEIAKFYRDNLKEFAVPEGVRVRHILVGLKKGAAAGDKAKAKEKAAGLLKQAQAKNADFAALAQKNSDDVGTKDQGGDLGGYITRDDALVKPFLDAVFAAKQGEVVGPVETEFGFHIIKIEEKKAARTLSLDEAREKLVRPYLLDTKRKQTFEAKITDLKAKAKIKKFV